MDTNESGEVKIKTMFLRFTVYCVFTCKSSSVLPSYAAFGWSCCCCAKAPVIAELPSTATRHTTLSRDTVVVLFCCLAACSSSLVCRRLIIIFHSVCVSLSLFLSLSPYRNPLANLLYIRSQNNINQCDLSSVRGSFFCPADHNLKYDVINKEII